MAADVITLLQVSAPAASAPVDSPALTASDLAAIIDAYVSMPSQPVSALAEASSVDAAATVGAGNDNFDFSATVLAPVVDDAALHPAVSGIDTIASAFDALQLANALNLDANGDVIVFDTSNVVTIKSLTTTLTPDSVI
jgi:hypothetical protein